MLRLSFIVPFYNVEPYIEECIRSLYNQDIPQGEYEVICVDDCSPDNSVAVIEDWKLKVENLKLIRHTENKRQGGARNTGLREAKGKYVWFVDADDTIQENCLKSILTQAEDGQLDVLRFYFSNGNGTAYNATKMIDSPIVSGSSAIFDIDSGEPLGVRCCSAVCQLIKASFLRRNEIKFTEYVQYEDDDFAYQLYAVAQRTKWMSIAPYIIRETQNSTTRRKTDMKKIEDLYNQTIRIIHMEKELSLIDLRWHKFIATRVNWTSQTQIVQMLHDLSFGERVQFFIKTFRTRHLYRPYLSKKSYVKFLFSF